MREILLLYFAVTAIAVLSLVPPIVCFLRVVVRSYKSGRSKCKKPERSKCKKARRADKIRFRRYMDRAIPAWKDKPRSEVRAIRRWGSKVIAVPLYVLLAIYFLPVALLRIGLSGSLGAYVTHKLPVSLYEVWGGLLLWACFSGIADGDAVFPLFVAGLIILANTAHLGSHLTVNAKGLKLYQTPEHKLSIQELVSTFLVVVLGYGCVFYGLAANDPASFNVPLSVVDAIYYSFMVGTMVGFGDINAVSDTARIVTLVEALFGFLFVIFMVAIFLNIWLERKRSFEEEEQATERDKPE